MIALGSCSFVSNSITPWTVACQVPLSMEFSRQEYRNELSFLSPGDLLNPGMKPLYPAIPALQADCLPLSHWENPISADTMVKNLSANARDAGLIPGSGKPLGEGNGNPLQHFRLENPMNRGRWWTTIHGVPKSWT